MLDRSRLRLATAAVATAALLAAPAATAAPWSKPVAVPGGTGGAFPAVAVARDGTAVVAFERQGIRVAVRPPDGRWEATRKVSAGKTNTGSAHVAVDGHGNIVVAWVQTTYTGNPPSHGPYYIRTATRARNGGWSTPQTLGISRHVVAPDIHVAANRRGDVEIVWRGIRRPKPHRSEDAIQSRFRPAGAAFGAARTAAGHPASGAQHLVLDDHGNAYAVWGAGVQLGTQRRGGPWTVRKVGPVNAGGPVLALARDGALVVAWGEVNSAGVVIGPIFGRIQPAGGRFGPAIQIGGQIAYGLHALALANGETVVAWGVERAGPAPAPFVHGLHYVVRPTGGTFGPEVAPAGLTAATGLAGFADSRLVAVWGGNAIGAATRPAGGSFGAPESVSGSGDFPAVAAADRLALVAWSETRGLMASVRSG